MTRRLVQLYVSLVLYGVSMAMMIRSGLGNMPWDVLHQGLAEQLGIPHPAVEREARVGRISYGNREQGTSSATRKPPRATRGC